MLADSFRAARWHRACAQIIVMFVTTPVLSGTAAHIEWASFEDPTEHAFRVEVPRGWSARGGSIRMGASDLRYMLDLTSPDERINIRLGDLALPVYSIAEGIGHGQRASMIVARYRSGPEFAVLYSHARFFQSCRNPTADLDDVDFVMPDYLPDDPAAVQTSTGQIAYRCDSPQGPRIIFAFVRTVSYGSYWRVPTLASYIGPADQAGLARAVLLHSAHSFRLQPQWSAEARWRRSDALDGVTETADPLTAEARQLWQERDEQYWTNGTGEVISARTRPSAAWHALEMTTSN
jgi:hypothetical protein